MTGDSPSRHAFREILAKYGAVFSLGLQNTFVYRWNFLLRSLFALIPLFGTVFVWRSIYGGTSGTIAGYDFGEMILYFLIVLLVENLITPAEDEWQIAAEIRRDNSAPFFSSLLTSWPTAPASLSAHVFSTRR